MEPSSSSRRHDLEDLAHRGPCPEGAAHPGRQLVTANGLQVKNTFIDCPSPWRLDTQATPRKSNSDPGSSSQYSSSSEIDSFTSGSEAEMPSRRGQLTRELEARTAKSIRLGDQGHAEGTCRPCKHWVKKAGCQDGDACQFCHLAHNAGHPLRNWRPCRAKRKRLQRLLEQLKSQAEEKGQSFDIDTAELPPSIAGNAFLRDEVKHWLQHRSRETGEAPCPGDAADDEGHGARQVPPTKPAPPAFSPPPESPESVVVLDREAPVEFGQVYRL